MQDLAAQHEILSQEVVSPKPQNSWPISDGWGNDQQTIEQREYDSKFT